MSRSEPLFRLGRARFFLSDLRAASYQPPVAGRPGFVRIVLQDVPDGFDVLLPIDFEQREADRLMMAWELFRAQRRKEPAAEPPNGQFLLDHYEQLFGFVLGMADLTLDPETGEPGDSDRTCHHCKTQGCVPDSPSCMAMEALGLLIELGLNHDEARPHQEKTHE